MKSTIRIKSRAKLISSFNRENCTTDPGSRYVRVTVDDDVLVFHHTNGVGTHRLPVEVDRATHKVFSRKDGWEETCSQLEWNA
jgi:hypothetical protein